jgi:hypothetical protein
MFDCGIYMPVYNCQDWARSLQLPAGMPAIAWDNASTDETVDLLRYHGVEVHQHTHNIGRVANWQACLDDFAASEVTWLKWLFAGDELYPQARNVLNQALAVYPTAEFVVAAYDIIDGSHRRRWHPWNTTRLIDPDESAWLMARRGNWTGAPLAHAIKRTAVPAYNAYGDFQWSADMRLALHISTRVPTLFIDEPIGAFHVRARAIYKSWEGSPRAFGEELLVRAEAIEMINARDMQVNQQLVVEVLQDIQRRMQLSRLRQGNVRQRISALSLDVVNWQRLQRKRRS